MINLKNIKKIYNPNSKYPLKVFEDFSLHISKGDMVAVMGRSGSGKSTLLSIIAMLTSIDKGEYYFDGILIDKKNMQGNHFRRDNIGIVIQNFALLEDRTAYKNVELAIKHKKISNKEKHILINDTFKRLDITDKQNNYPPELSGGQCQKTAIARAIISSPSIILADEPTGSLDETSENEIMDIFKELNENGTTLVIATHNKAVANRCKRIVNI